MSGIGRRHASRLALLTALLASMAFAPGASAQDEPAFVAPCADGFEWTAESGQPILFLCGWGVQGGPGKIVTFLNAYQATLTVEDEDGQPVLTIGPAEFATLWGDPEQSPSGFDDVTCAGPTGMSVLWTYLLEEGLPEGTYTVSLEQSLRYPVGDGFHTCWFDDGTRVAAPPNRMSGSFDAVSTLVVDD
jgi:hypothetical protein